MMVVIYRSVLLGLRFDDFDFEEALARVATNRTDVPARLRPELLGAIGAHAQVSTREHGGVARFAEANDALFTVVVRGCAREWGTIGA